MESKTGFTDGGGVKDVRTLQLYCTDNLNLESLCIKARDTESAIESLFIFVGQRMQYRRAT